MPHACCLRTESILCWFVQHYYHLRWTRIPRETKICLIIRKTQHPSRYPVSHNIIVGVKIRRTKPAISPLNEAYASLNPTILANSHCLETQDIHFTSGDFEIHINFTEIMCSTTCRLSGYRLRGMSAHWMSAPWNRLSDSRLSESRLSGMSPYHAVGMTLRMERIMVGIALPDHKRNTWIRHQTPCWTSPYFIYGTQT